MATTRTRSRSRTVSEDPSPETVARFERDLRAVVRRHNARAQGLAEVADERDQLIRRAHAAGLGPMHIAEVTGLSNKRIEQISRG